MGAYLGLFNATICIPQIVAAIAGGALLHLLGSVQANMLGAAGVLLLLGCVAVGFVKVGRR
jgi:maltose/moltooligosaccharide transporter